MNVNFLKNCYPDFEPELLMKMEQHAIFKIVNPGEPIVKQGQYIKFLPIVVKGCVKVFCKEATADFLLYYIEAGESCIYSFAHINSKTKADFMATAILKSELLLLPIDKVNLWLKKHPSLNTIIINNYKKHYNDLLNTTKQVICHNLEDRLINYLQVSAEVNKTNILNLSHQTIASDLGTSREVISRIMKSKNLKKIAQQIGRKIKIL